MSGTPIDDSEPSIHPDLVRESLRALYTELDEEIAAIGPTCLLSGRCCRFQEYDHTLFLSEAEAALLIADAPPPNRPVDDGATCPWQDEAGRCRARDARPLGCRVYYCDSSYEGRAELLSERYLARLRRLVEALALPWNYARLHHHLHAAVASGLLQIRKADDGQPAGHPDSHERVPVREVLDISLSDQ